MSDYHDYHENLAFPPIGSQDDLNEQGRQSEVLIAALEKCERLEQENQQLKELLKYCHYYIINTPVYPQGDDAKQVEIHKLSDQITNAIGEKK